MSEIMVLRPDVLDPPRRPLELAPRKELPQQPVLGLVVNGKPLARELLQALQEAVQARLQRKVDVHMISKPNAAHPITSAQADDMAARAHIVITGVGD